MSLPGLDLILYYTAQEIRELVGQILARARTSSDRASIHWRRRRRRFSMPFSIFGGWCWCGGGREWRLNGGHTHETGVLLLLRRLLCSALCHLWLGLYLRNYYYDSGTRINRIVGIFYFHFPILKVWNYFITFLLLTSIEFGFSYLT